MRSSIDRRLYVAITTEMWAGAGGAPTSCGVAEWLGDGPMMMSDDHNVLSGSCAMPVDGLAADRRYLRQTPRVGVDRTIAIERAAHMCTLGPAERAQTAR